MIRGRIVAHRLRVCPTLTRAPSRRRPRPPPPPRTLPGAGIVAPHLPRPCAGAAGAAWSASSRLAVLVIVLVGGLRGRPRPDQLLRHHARAGLARSPSTSRCHPQYRHPLTGKILLTDVYVTQLNALSYLQYRFFDSNSADLPGRRAVGGCADGGPVPQPGLPADGAGPELRHGGRADPARLPGELHATAARWSTASRPSHRRRRPSRWPR